MTSEVIKGHIGSPFHLKIKFFSNMLVVQNLLLSKPFMIANIMKTQICHEVKCDLSFIKFNTSTLIALKFHRKQLY